MKKLRLLLCRGTEADQLEADYFLFHRQPKFQDHGHWVFDGEGFSGELMRVFCHRGWHHQTGIRLRPGEIREVEITQSRNKFTFRLLPKLAKKPVKKPTKKKARKR